MSWSPGSDREWRRLAVPHIAKLCTPTWPDSYRGHLVEISEFMVARVEGALTKGGQIKWSECRADCVIYFGRVPLCEISVTNPEREARAAKGYPQLRAQLERDPGYDAVPVVLKRLGEQFTVWDGHHRLRTYRQAQRQDIPSLVAWIVPGDGKVRLLRQQHPGTSAGLGTGSL
jgi:hypothetical protein